MPLVQEGENGNWVLLGSKAKFVMSIWIITSSPDWCVQQPGAARPAGPQLLRAAQEDRRWPSGAHATAAEHGEGRRREPELGLGGGGGERQEVGDGGEREEVGDGMEREAGAER